MGKMLLKTVNVFILFFLGLAWSQLSLGQDVDDNSTKPDVELVEAVDHGDWGIYNGCISSNRISNIQVLGVNAALLELVDGKKIVMRFVGRCPGIRQYGFVYTARNNLFCEKKQSVRVMETGTHCRVASLRPYIEDEGSAEADK